MTSRPPNPEATSPPPEAAGSWSVAYSVRVAMHMLGWFWNASSRRLRDGLWVLGGACCVAALGLAGDFEFQSTKPVPEHAQPWVESAKPDIRTVFLWKFITDADRDKAAADVLDNGNLDELLEDDDGPVPAAGGQAAAGGGADNPPKLVGKAKLADAAGRFGGGLSLDGTGYAEGMADLAGLVASEGGFTVDGWFRSANTAAADKPQTLLAIPDSRGRPLLAVVLKTPTEVIVSVEGTERIAAPLAATADGWHYFAVVVDVPRERPDAATLGVIVDGQKETADRSDPSQSIPRMNGVLARIGTRLTVGGAEGRPGFTGSLDELRLSKGVRHIYPWSLGRLELARTREALDMKAPYFKSGSVLTRLHFDGSLEPELFAGRSWAGKATAENFAAGVQGQALDLSAIDKTGFAMKGFDILPDKDGTVEFWFRPLDWNNFYQGEFRGSDVKSNWLMTLTAKDAPYHSASKEIEIRLGRSGQDGQLHWQKVHPGTWTHVLFSIKDGRQTVYVNGRPQRLHQAALVTRASVYDKGALEKWRERTGGKDVDDTWTLAFTKSPTLVDEFSVYSWPLDADEAWNAYARWLPDAAEQMKPLPSFQTTFDYFAHSWDRNEKLVATVACLPVGGLKPASADIEIRTAAGEVLLAAEKQPLDEASMAKFTVDKPLAFGRYLAIVRSRDASEKVLKEENVEYVREKPQWLGNTLGEERTIPKAWTPIKANGQSLELVGRRIELGSTGLPDKIETFGRQILARPFAMRAAGPGGDAVLVGQGMKLGATADDRVEWQAALAGAGIKADVDAWLEFDGLLYCTVTLKPASGAEATLDELDVDVPMVAAEATQLLANGGGPDFRASWLATMLPAGEGSVWRSSDKPYPAFVRADGVTNFMPHIWLGADDVGIYFGAENDKGWTVDGPHPAQEILREKDTVVFRMNVIREATKIPTAGRTFHFILLPTPAKPEPVDWRKQMAAGGVNFGACDTFGGFDMKTDPSDPMQGDDFRWEPRSWEHAEAMSPQCRAKWGRCILYADASWPRMGPAFRDWDHDLYTTGRLAWTPECEDYAVWAINEFLKRGIIDGVYWDDVSVGTTYSLDSTAYEYAAGKNGRRVGFTSLALRRVNMRLWRLFEAAGREPCIWAHMTVCYEVPLFSFCRYLSNGEFVTGVEPYGKRDAMDFWKPETLRILGPAEKWGAGVNFLTTLPRSLPPGPAAEQWAYPQHRAEDALYATSGIQTLSEGLTRKLVAEKVYDKPLRFFPWWRADQVLKVAVPEKARVLSAVYAIDDRAIVFVSNADRDVEHEVTVELDLAKLFPDRKGGGSVTWRDLDPGLDPPKVDVADAAEIKKQTAAAADAGLDAKEGPLDDEAIGDLLEGTSPEGRAKGRLVFKAEGSKARVVIRPRDYRVLEARPAF